MVKCLPSEYYYKTPQYYTGSYYYRRWRAPYYYRKYYYRRRYRGPYNNLSQKRMNYFNGRFEWTDQLFYPDNDGAPYINSRREQNPPQNLTLSIQDMLTNSQYFSAMSRLYQWFKVTGIRIEAVPAMGNIGKGTQQCQENQIVVDWGAQQNAVLDTTMKWQALNNAMLLDPMKTKTAYFKNPDQKYIAIAQNEQMNILNIGAVRVTSFFNSNKQNGPQYTFKFCVYVRFKQSLI